MVEPEVLGMGGGGYVFGSIAGEKEEPFLVRIPVPSLASLSDSAGKEGLGLSLKVTMAYDDLPGPSLANDLNLVVLSGDGTKERHGNQGDQEFHASSEKSFDRRNNVKQVVWPQVTGDSVQVLVKPYRMMLSDVPFAYAWKFSQE